MQKLRWHPAVPQKNEATLIALLVWTEPEAVVLKPWREAILVTAYSTQLRKEVGRSQQDALLTSDGGGGLATTLSFLSRPHRRQQVRSSWTMPIVRMPFSASPTEWSYREWGEAQWFHKSKWEQTADHCSPGNACKRKRGLRSALSPGNKESFLVTSSVLCAAGRCPQVRVTGEPTCPLWYKTFGFSYRNVLLQNYGKEALERNQNYGMHSTTPCTAQLGLARAPRSKCCRAGAPRATLGLLPSPGKGEVPPD